LYSLGSHDLGTSAESVEKSLLSSLELAESWNAIVLIDEADVFLERRDIHDLERNGLVAGMVKCNANITFEYYN
jgi:hypothetical protein